MLLTTIVSVVLTLVLFGFASAGDFYVTPTGAGAKTGGSWGSAFDKIQDAINACGAGSDTIHCGPGTFTNDSYPIVFNSKTDILVKGYGQPHKGPTIQGDGANRVIEILYSTVITIRNFKITGGFVYGNGGGIYVDYSDEILLDDLEVTENTCNGENANGTGDGGGMALRFSTVDVIGCCIWRNYAYVDAHTNGGSGGGIALFDPDMGASDRGYFIRDCCIFWNEADIAGGGIYLSGDDGYSAIENNLIRQNCINESGKGAGIHSECAKLYVRNNTVADNYYCPDEYDDTGQSRGGPPKWGYFPDGTKPTTNVYGIWACDVSPSYWMKGVHNIVYFNGPWAFDDWNIKTGTVYVWYSDVQMSAANSQYPSSNNSNFDKNQLFLGGVDEDRPCNSTFYLLALNSPCIDAGMSQAAEPWEAC